jgi:hypothetical protein
MAVDKNWTLNCLRHNRNSGILSIGALALLNSSAVDRLTNGGVVLRGDEVIFHASESDRHGTRYEIDLQQIVSEYHDHHDRYLHTLGEFLRSHRRNLLKESFEVAKAYAISTAQLPGFKAVPCFTFARLIRNSVSHDLHFRFRNDVLAVLPVSYGGVTLDASLQNQPMRQNHLSPWLAWKIHDELAAFVSSH